MALVRALSRPKMLSSLTYSIRLVHNIEVSADEAHINHPTAGHKCYPCLARGPKNTVFSEIDPTKGIYFRMDMPGVQQDGLKLTLKGSTLFFEGEAPGEPQFEDFEKSGRRFAGSYEFIPADGFDFARIQAKISAGVLRVFAPSKTYDGF